MTSKLIIVLVTTISLMGCTTMRTMDAQQPDFVEQLEVGDHLVVYEKSGRVVDMTLTEIDGSVLYGSVHDSGLTTVEVDLQQIVKVEIEKISGVKTTAAILGGIVLLPIAIVGAGFALAEQQ